VVVTFLLSATRGGSGRSSRGCNIPSGGLLMVFVFMVRSNSWCSELKWRATRVRNNTVTNENY
jgi:hypothetical protein